MKTTTLEIPCSGYSVVADWYEGADDKQILLVLHGYTSSRARQRDLISVLVEETGTSALAIDYSGHGDSPFELRDTRPAQHLLEVVLAYDWLREHHPEATISVMGTSYGGFLAAHLTNYRPVDKLLFRVPAIYKPETLYDPWSIRLDNADAYRDEMAAYRQDTETQLKHPMFANAAGFQGKSLVVVHGADELVPRETTDAFIKAFGADSFTAENFMHSIGDSFKHKGITEQQLREYQLKAAEWLKTAQS
jgi:uncharacterized protein